MAIGVLAILSWVIVEAVKGRHNHEAQRLDVLEKALARPDLDAETRRELLTTLSRERERRAFAFLRRGSFWRMACFAVGWATVLIFGGIALLTVMGATHAPYESTLIPCVFGVALMTLPTAIREFARREEPRTETR